MCVPVGPTNNPSRARSFRRTRVFCLRGLCARELWRGGVHGRGTPRVAPPAVPKRLVTARSLSDAAAGGACGRG